MVNRDTKKRAVQMRPTLLILELIFLRVGCTDIGGTKTSECVEGELLRMPELLSSSTTSCN